MIVKMLLVLFILFVICLLLVYLHYFPAIPRRKKKYPYALLLGCPSHNDGSYATSQIRRCELAMEAYKKGYFDTLIISGGAVKNQYVESLQMEKYIRKRIAMPIVCETKARNTWENFQFTKEKIDDVPVLIPAARIFDVPAPSEKVFLKNTAVSGIRIISPNTSFVRSHHDASIFLSNIKRKKLQNISFHSY